MSEDMTLANIIKGTTRVCGLIGNPVEHTLSPLIHNSLAAICGHDLVYVPFRVESGRVKEAVRGAYGLNILGMNVTVPHKVEVMEALCGIDDVAGAIGAVNTLVRTEDGFIGYNTDVYGLDRALMSEGIDLKDRTVVLLGAGGAARACAFLCAMKRAGKVYILNRSADKAVSLADDVNKYAGYDLCTAHTLEEYRAVTENDVIALQASSVGLYPDHDRVIIDNEEFYRHVGFGFDLVYKPSETGFMKMVKNAGGKTSNGLKMLLYQGVEAYARWNDIEIDDEMASAVYARLAEAVRS